MRKVLAVAAVALTTVTAQIPPAPMKTVWEGMYPPPYLTNPQIVLDMDCVSKDQCYLGGGSNGVGFGVYKYDGQMNGQVVKMMEPNMSLFVMDIAMGGTKEDPRGAFSSIVDFTFGKGLQYLAKQGKEWLPSMMPLEIVWASQSITTDAAGKSFVAVGDGFTADLMISSDYGVSFKNQPMTYKSSDECTAPGNIATPAPDAWFLTWGAQPERNNSNNGGGGGGGGGGGNGQKKVNPYHHRVNMKHVKDGEAIVGVKANGRVLVIRHLATGKTRVHTKSIKEARADRVAAMKVADHKCNYYTGSILKSTDKGKTWSLLFTLPTASISYIECATATNCVAIAFNEQTSHTITSTDGNAFKVTYTTPATQTYVEEVSAVGFQSETEVWVGGSRESQTAGAGMFWSSSDKGETWTMYPHTIPDVMAIMAIDFADKVGFAVGITMFKTAQIMRYTKQADYGNFIQSHCPFAGCSFLCQNNTFPQGMCLSTRGGSAKAFCTSEGVTQYVYGTTSCVGPYTTHTQPINQCLNGTQGSFFENYCPGSGSSFASAPSTGAQPQF